MVENNHFLRFETPSKKVQGGPLDSKKFIPRIKSVKNTVLALWSQTRQLKIMTH